MNSEFNTASGLRYVPIVECLAYRTYLGFPVTIFRCPLSYDIGCYGPDWVKLKGIIKIV